MSKKIWFDMDGTIYNLYEIPNWLEYLRSNNMKVFDIPGYGRKSLPKIRKAISALQARGWEVGVITWAPMDVKMSDKAFVECAHNKLNWLKTNVPEINPDDFFCLEYGKSKREWADMLEPYAEMQVLVDDNKCVRADWRKAEDFLTINASRGYIKELEGLLG